MQYSDTILTDDNFDEEIEKLSEIIGIHFNNYDSFVTKIDDSFSCQTHEKGFEEWIKCGVYPNKGSDYTQAYQKGYLAYEFGNGFVIFKFETLL